MQNVDEKKITDASVWEERRAVYGANSLPPPRSKSFLMFSWEALQDKTLIFLIIAALVEVAVGIYKAVSADELFGIYDGF
jgi:Ca2+-transporting ATPase